jgi:hypothetical protein
MLGACRFTRCVSSMPLRYRVSIAGWGFETVSARVSRRGGWQIAEIVLGSVVCGVVTSRAGVVDAWLRGVVVLVSDRQYPRSEGRARGAARGPGQKGGSPSRTSPAPMPRTSLSA